MSTRGKQARMLRNWLLASLAIFMLGGPAPKLSDMVGPASGTAPRLSSGLPGMVFSDAPHTSVRRLHADFDPTEVRLEAEYDGPSEPHAYLNRDRGAFCIDFNDVDAGAVTVAAPPHDDLVTSWTIERPTFRRAVWVCHLRYPIPGENFTVRSEKGRLVVGILRKYDPDEATRLTKGVKWLKSELLVGGRVMAVNQLRINLKDKSVRLDVALAHDDGHGVEPTSRMVARKAALAGVNGGFFGFSQGALGLVVADGKVVVPPVDFRPPRTAFGITKDHHIVMDQVKLDGDKLVGLHGTDWSKVQYALGGGPRLVKDGKIEITADEEGLGANGNNIGYRAARTALGVLPDHQLLIVTLRGNTDGDRGGILFQELAEYMLSQKCVDAMCLDGGGSSAMAIGDNLVDHSPGARDERPVADALLVYDKNPSEFPSRVMLKVDRLEVPADGQTELHLTADAFTSRNTPVADGTLIEFRTTLGEPMGRVKAVHGEARMTLKAPPVTGVAALQAICGSGRDAVFVHYVPGPAAHLYARAVLAGPPPPTLTPSPSPSVSGSPLRIAQIMPDSPSPSPAVGSPAPEASPAPSPTASPSGAPLPTPGYAPRYLVDILVTDALGNPLVGEPVTARWLAASGPQDITRATDSNGVITVEVVPAPAGTGLDVSHAGLPPLRVVIPGWH